MIDKLEKLNLVLRGMAGGIILGYGLHAWLARNEIWPEQFLQFFELSLILSTLVVIPEIVIRAIRVRALTKKNT